MRTSFFLRLCAPLPFIFGCHAETLAEYALRGIGANRESYYALAAVKPEKVRLTLKDPDRELIIVSDGETTLEIFAKNRATLPRLP